MWRPAFYMLICIRRSFNRRNPRSIMLANPPICWAQKSGNIEVRRKSSETFYALVVSELPSCLDLINGSL